MAHLIYLNSYEINLSDLSHSQICQRVRSVICEAVRVRSERPYGRPWESDWPLTHSGRCSPILGPVAPLPAEAMHLAVKSVRRARGSDCIARCAWEADRTLRSERPNFGLSDLRGRVRERPWESDRTLPAEAMRLAVKSVRRARGSDCIARCAWEADWTLRSERPNFGLSDLRGRVRERPCSADWLRQVTWQIWEAVCLWGRISDSQIWEAVCVRGRAPLILSLAQIDLGLSDTDL